MTASDDPPSGPSSNREPAPGVGAPQRHSTSRIGLLGGSFNPAHEGHREISLAALKHLCLDAVWWLVSPGNPLKDPDTYAPYEARLAHARRIADHHRIIISNFEERKSLQYTVDTLTTLTDLWPQIKFVWLMGADSLENFHLWRDWKKIAHTAPIAVLNRPGYTDEALKSVAAKELSVFKVESRHAETIFGVDPPVWTYIETTNNPASSTELRNAGKAGPEWPSPKTPPKT